MNNQEIEKEVLQFVESEVTKYKDGEYFITENISIAFRPLVRLLRKNYYGIFTEPRDPVTGKEKTWVPLTRLVVDSVRKQSDLDLKDINFHANKRKGISITSLVRGFIREWLYSRFFGETLDDTILQLCIDGTVVWKTYPKTVNGKLDVKRKTVDLLNFYIDPTAESIQADGVTVTERALMTPNELRGMNGLMNTDGLKTQRGLHPNETDLRQINETGEYLDVYETWGQVPLRWITGKKNDTDLIEAQMIVSGLETGDRRVHLVRKNTNKDKAGNIIKPYEELRYMKVPNRWAGVGPAEMVLKLQEWINTIVNLRIVKNTTASLGLFKVRTGAGVTQQALSNLVSKGVIKLNDLDDIQNFDVSEAGEASYRDEEVAKNWAYGVTSTYDIARGESLPASSTATSAVIEDRNAKTAFTLVVETVGMFLQRWIDRHVLPHVPKMIKQKGIVRCYGDFNDIEQLRKSVVAYLVDKQLDEAYENGDVPTEQDLQMAIEEAESRLRREKDLFFDVVDDLITEQVDTVASFTNETTDVAVTVKNLIDMAQMVPPEAQRDFVVEALDLLGIEAPESLRGSQGVAQPQGGPQDMLAGQPPEIPLTTPTEQSLVTGANTL